jgi:hypothetical protein
MTVLRLSTAAVLFAVAAEVSAQASPSESAGFQGIILTPVGALPQVLHVPPVDQPLPRFTTEVAYGRYRFQGNPETFHNIGFSARVQAHQRVSAGVTLGNRSCSGCEGLRMAGADVQADLWQQAADERGEGRASLALRLHAGYGQPNRFRFNARSLAASLPVAVTLPQNRGSELTLFFSPVLAYGYINDGAGTILGRTGGDGATRAVIGAGLGYRMRQGLGLHMALHKVVIEDGPTQFGAGASWSFGKLER